MVSKHRTPSLLLKLRTEFGSRNGELSAGRLISSQRFLLRAIDGSVSASAGQDHSAPNDEVVKSENKYGINLKDPVEKLHGIISSFSPVVFSVRFSFLILGFL